MRKRMLRKKSASLLIAAAMVLTSVPVYAEEITVENEVVVEESSSEEKTDLDSEKNLAGEPIAKIGDQSYYSLTDAISAIPDGIENQTTIVLQKDAYEDAYAWISKKAITVDLNGHDIIFAYNKGFLISNGTLNLTGRGTVYEEDPCASPVTLYGSSSQTAANYSVLNVDRDVTLQGWAGVFVDHNYGKNYGIVVNLNGCTIISKQNRSGVGGYGVYVDDQIANETNPPIITIKEGTSIVSENGYGMYLAGYNRTTINGAAITGADGSSGIEIRAGELTIYNSTVTGGKGELSVTPNDKGATTKNAAVAVAQHITQLPIDVKINGGTYEGNYAFYESNPQENPDVFIQKVKVSIRDGKFKENSIYAKDLSRFVWGGYYAQSFDSRYIADGKSLLPNDGPYKEEYKYAVDDIKNAEVKPSIGDSKIEIPEGLENLKDAAENVIVDDLDMYAKGEANKLTEDETSKIKNEGIEQLRNAGIISAADSVQVKLHIRAFLEIRPRAYSWVLDSSNKRQSSYTLDIIPKYQFVVSTASNPNDIKIKGESGVPDTEANAVVVGEAQILDTTGKNVHVQIPLPDGFFDGGEIPAKLSVKHVKYNGETYVYRADVFKYSNKNAYYIAFDNPYGFGTFTVSTSLSNNSSSLSGLSISAGDLTFKKDTTSYTAVVENSVASITVTPVSEDVFANIRVNGTSAVSGAASVPIALKEGYNTIKAEVTSADGNTTKTYTIKITRAAAKNRTFTISRRKYTITNELIAKATVAITGLSDDQVVNLSIPDTVKIYGITYKITSIGKNAFRGMPKMKTARIGNNVTTVGYAAFYTCPVLNSVTLGTEVKTIGNHVFCRSTKLRTLIFEGTALTNIGSHELYKITGLTIKAPASKVKAYQTLFTDKGAQNFQVVKK